jgi:hypothetical protein
MAASSESAPKKPGCRGGVPFLLHDKVQDLALVIDRAPEIHTASTDVADHFIEMPSRRRRRPQPL